MIFIFISIFCSLLVSILLKLAPRYGIDVHQAIAGNYLVAVVLSWLVFRPDPDMLVAPSSTMAWVVLLGLGVLLPSIFWVLAVSMRRVGMARTDAAQRLSLVLPLIAAFTLFGEVLTWQKGGGVMLGLLAIVLVVMRHEKIGPVSRRDWMWPALVFAGFGAIDILFKLMAQLGQAFSDVLFATFVLAFVLYSLFLLRLRLAGRLRFAWRHILGAIMLGGFNFGNIVFYVEAHRQLATNPALVFSTMNIGVIVLSVIIGLWFFHERLARMNKIGLLVAVAAVIVLTNA